MYQGCNRQRDQRWMREEGNNLSAEDSEGKIGDTAYKNQQKPDGNVMIAGCFP
jgi:hypothetical protein